LAYRTPIGEPILIGLLILQVITGLTIGTDAFPHRASVEYLIQMACSLYIVMFLGSHVLAVAVQGRQLLNHGPDFTYASPGPDGLLSTAGGVALAPYYCLAVIAFFAHLSRPSRLQLTRVADSDAARRSTHALVGAGGLIAIGSLSASVPR
jgi:hypothetical protein